MARSERRGYRTSRSSGPLQFASRRMVVVRGLLALMAILVLSVAGAAQDVNVHIEPRTKTDPAKPDSNTAPKASDTAIDKNPPAKYPPPTPESHLKTPRTFSPVHLPTLP